MDATSWPGAGAAAAVLAGGLALAVLVSKRRRDALCAVCDRQVARRHMAGCVAMVTGAGSGLGLELAVRLLANGATLIATCHSHSPQQLMQRLKERWPADSESPAAWDGSVERRVTVVPLDLSSLRSVGRCAQAVLLRTESLGKLDVLACNAAIMGAPYALSDDGFETHFAINHLGHFHLCNLLAPLIAKGDAQWRRIVIVSSGYYKKAASIGSVGALHADVRARSVSPWSPAVHGYGRSKLDNVLHAVELAKRLAHVGVDVYSVRPGFVRGTELGRHHSALLRWLGAPLIWYFSRSLHQGAQTLLHCCLSDKADLRSGALYADCAEEPLVGLAADTRAPEELWKLSEACV